jgi:hypothetical protein
MFNYCSLSGSRLVRRAVNGLDSNRIPEDLNENPLKIYKIHMRIHIQENFEDPNTNLYLLL